MIKSYTSALHLIVTLALFLAPALAFGQGFVIVSGDDADDSGHCQGTRCGRLYPNLFTEGLARSRSSGTGILAIGVNSSSALSAFNSWNNPSNGGPGAAVTHARSTSDIAAADFSQFALVYVASTSRHTSGGISSSQIAALNARQPDLAEYVNEQGGALIMLTQEGALGEWGSLPVPLVTADQSFTNATPTEELQELSPLTTQSNLSHCCFHNVFTGPPGYSGLKVLAIRTDTGLPVMLGGVSTILTAEICDDGIDNDEDGLIDRDDPDCRICGDGILDPEEGCDDGNNEDGDGCSATCELEDNLPPVALCQPASLDTEFNACSTGVSVDAGSYDPEGGPLSFGQSPASPYAPGTTQVTLTVEDPAGAGDSCGAAVTILDNELPRTLCNAPVALDGALESASFTSGGTDNCPLSVALSDPVCRNDDVDDDGVPDDEDECPDSDLSDILVIADCDTGVVNVLFETGCTISDLVFVCGEEAENHGDFVSCVAHLTNELVSQEVITGREKGEIQRCAAQAPIPIPRGPSSAAALDEGDPAACPVVVDGTTISFPEVPGIGLLSWTVTVTDAGGNSRSETCSVAVQNPSTTFINLTPQADAGTDQEALIGDTVGLDGSGSLDLDGDPLTFQWSLAAPAGSTAVLSDPGAGAPSFVVDAPGTYVAELVVDDGVEASTADRVEVRVRNRPPVADAGADHSVLRGGQVTFDGSASADPDGDAITFSWTLAVQPAGSVATLSDPTTAAPALTVDRRGAYVAQLVVHDGAVASLIDASIVIVPNAPPVAEAGPDQDISVFDTVQLDGTGSTDYEGDPLSYQWTITSVPSGSTATLSSVTAADPTFEADLAGVYVIELVVSDGFDASAPDTVTITTVNTPPVADAGPNQTRFLGDLVQLDGSASSDVDGDPLTYEWTVISRPSGSAATLSDPTAVDPTFVADVRGAYTFELTVFDGQRFSRQPDRVTVAVINRAPEVRVSGDLNGSVTYPSELDASATFDPDGDRVTYQWTLLSRPSGSTAALSRADAPRPFFTPDQPGEYVAQVTASDGDLSASATVALQAVAANAAPNAAAGRDVAVLVGQTVTLDGRGSLDLERAELGLSYTWTFQSLPPGSLLNDADLAASATPSFAPDVAGSYVVELSVGDGEETGTDTVTVTAAAAGLPPHADPGPDLDVRSDEVFVVDGGGSFDPDGQPLSYAWSLVSAPASSAVTGADVVTPASPSTSFVPDVEGMYVLRLSVGDGTASAAANVVVHVDDQAPGLSFTEPEAGEVFYSGTLPSFELLHFDQGTGSALSSFRLVVAGEDVTAQTSLTTTYASFAWSSPLGPGTYEATATLADRAGNERTATLSFTVSSSVFRAIADCSPTEGVVPLTVRFRSRGEFDAGSIVLFRWDFEGDGRFDTSDPVARDFTRTFETGGTREAVLEVTNNFGDRVTDTCTIRVSGTPPVVTVDASPSNGPAPLEVSFTCDATDPDGSVALYEWDFEGDGVFDVSSPTSGAVTHTYGSVGTFEARCRVTDADGLQTTARPINTTVRVGPPGTPSVTATAAPVAGEAPLDVTFDGTAVDDGSIVLWEWDFNGDGVFDFSSPTSPATTLSYGDAGVFAAALRVTDDSGLSSVDQVEIDVDVAVTLAIPDDTFVPADGEGVAVETTLSGGVAMRLFVEDPSGTVVRRLFDGFRAAGTHTDTWDGTDESGLPLSHGPYYVVVEYDVGDETKKLDLTNTTGGVRYNPPRSGFPSTFRPLEDDLLDVNFTIPAAQGASEVTAFIGLFNTNTRFLTLVERAPFGVGAHALHWDGTAPSGGIAVAPPGDSFLFGIFGFTLPDNAVMLVAAPTLSDVSVEPNFFDPSTPDFLTPSQPVAVVTYTLDKDADVELTVTNLTTNVVVRTILEPVIAAGSGLTLSWDGQTDNGLFADRGDYRLTLRAIDGAGNVSINRFALVRVFY